MDLPVVFTLLMGVAILAYVVLDGYDLGVGMLMPTADRDEQNRMVASIGPFWDANETWLVLGIGLLLVAFPLAHGEILGALYLPVAAMLVGLMLRGVAFELRIKAEGWHRELWNWLFWAGSTLASLAQGFMLGRYITGFAAGAGYWGFALLVAASLAAVTCCSARPGSCCAPTVRCGSRRRRGRAGDSSGSHWAWRSSASPRRSSARRCAKSGSTSRARSRSWCCRRARFACGSGSGTSSADRNGSRSRGAVAIYVLAFIGLAYSLFPFVVIDRLTIWDAAAHPSALSFVLVGTIIVLPFIIGYTVWSCRVFRGKARADDYGHGKYT